MSEAAGMDFLVLDDPAGPVRDLAGCVAAIGNFDGVHRGHRALFQRAEALAARIGKPCIALTFEPHPADFFAGRPVIFRLTPRDAKAVALQRAGLDAMVVLGFNAALAAVTAEDFVTDILIRRLGVSAVVAGYDFHFGRKRAGTPDFLRDAGMRHGFDVEIVPRVLADAHGSLEAVSSTATRAALERGDVATARALLGHDYFVLGTVIGGAKLGRTLGYPTANMRLDASCRLRHGIYAVRMRVDGQERPGVASFGRRPTFDNGAPLLETFLFDFSGDLYGKRVEVDFAAWLRDEKKFDGIDTLVVQMKHDEAQARALLAPR